MDLTHSFHHVVDIAAVPEDLGALLIDLSARQENSPTAVAQSGLAPAGPAPTGSKAAAVLGGGLLTPPHGAFNPRVAARLTRWKDR